MCVCRKVHATKFISRKVLWQQVELIELWYLLRLRLVHHSYDGGIGDRCHSDSINYSKDEMVGFYGTLLRHSLPACCLCCIGR